MGYYLKNLRIVDPTRNLDAPGALLIRNGVLAEAAPGPDDEVIDCQGLTAAPGLVDMHVHLRDPGQTHKEDLFSACRAAAAGGVTSLLAMPNTAPSMDSPQQIKELLARAKDADATVYTSACVTQGLKGQVCCDYEELKQAGAIALSDDGRPVGSTRCLLEGLERARNLGLVFAAHCEDLELAKGGLMNSGKVSRRMGIKGIPPAAEDCGVAREIAAAASIGAPVHICHVSTKGSVALIRDAKRRGIKVTAETCPHYLLLTDRMLETMDADYRMNPPLGSEEDRLALLEALADGTIDAISTDHAPHTPAQKQDFIQAPNGVVGLETSFGVCMTALVHTGVFSLYGLVERMSTLPAKLMHLPAGTLKPGSAADLMLFDPNEEWIVDPAKFRSKARNSPFKGMTLKGKVKMTFLGGRIVFDDRNPVR